MGNSNHCVCYSHKKAVLAWGGGNQPSQPSRGSAGFLANGVSPVGRLGFISTPAERLRLDRGWWRAVHPRLHQFNPFILSGPAALWRHLQLLHPSRHGPQSNEVRRQEQWAPILSVNRPRWNAHASRSVLKINNLEASETCGSHTCPPRRNVNS